MTRRTKINCGLFVALILLFGGACGKSSKNEASVVPEHSPKATIPSIEWTDCQYPNLPGKLRCGVLRVYENREARQGRVLELKFVILPARREPTAPDPIFSIYGGPGQTATEYVEVEWEAAVREHREIVLLDQRGTSESNALNCSFARANLEAQEYLKPMFRPEAVKACREELEQRADLRFYGTPLAMDDLDDLRSLLRYDTINLKGGSYGSRAILTYIQRHAAHVRRVTMISLAPFSFKNPLYHSRSAQEALDKLFAECDDQPACREAFPKLREELAEVLRRLETTPAQASVTHPESHQKAEVRLGRAEFAEALRVMTYRRDSASMVPLAIHRAFEGDFGPFAQLAVTNNFGLRVMLRFGMLLCTTCSEDVARITEEDIVRETRDTYLGDDRVRQQVSACKEWPESSLPKEFDRPQRSDVPALLLSGYYDPATPPWFGEEVARNYLPNSIHLVLRTAGHSPMSECTEELTREFFERGDISGLDTTCVKTLAISPFVTQMPSGQ